MTEFFGRRKFPPSYYSDSRTIPRGTLILPNIERNQWAHSNPDSNVLKSKPKERVDVLHPPTVVRRTVALETGNQHGHNHSRVSNMQHKMYMDYINSRKPAFYGNRSVQEEYKRNLRESLKSQMRESADKRRQEFDHNRL